MTGTTTLLFLKVLCDIELKKNDSISTEAAKENSTSCDENAESPETLMKIYMQEKHGEGGSLGSKRYACHKCSCLFRRKRHLRRHLNIHCSHKCLGCSECFAEITNSYHGLLRGVQKTTGVFPCLSCKLKFRTPAGLAIHQEFHPQPGNVLRCGSCSETFANRLDLDSHQKIHITSEVHKCTSCSKAFTTPSNLAKHRQSRHVRRTESYGEHFLSALNAAANEDHDSSLKFACDLCGVVCSSDNELGDHVKKHFMDGQIRCLECSKLFKTKEQLSKHMHVHRSQISRKKRKAVKEDIESAASQQGPECSNCLNEDMCDEHQGDPVEEDGHKTCNLCLRVFRFQLYNAVHVCQAFPPIEDLNEETLAENGFHCPACSKKYASFLPLKLHMDVHKGADPLHCKLCDRGFSVVSKLDYHLEYHGRNTCLKCGIFFHTRLQLLLHDCGISKRDFSCSTCGEEFPSMTGYRKHWRIHPPSNDPKYQCSECNQKFLKESNFRAHRMRHTGTYPFSCMLCDEKFLTFSALRNHSLEHLSKKTIQCEECDKVFTSQLKFVSHRKKHEKEAESPVKEEQNENAGKYRRQYDPLKPQECPYCGIVFRREYQLLLHKGQAHNDKAPYTHVCELCSRGFYLELHYKMHLESCSVRNSEERKKCPEQKVHSESCSVSNSGEGKKCLKKKECSESSSVSNSEEGKTCLKKKVPSESCSVSNSGEGKKCLKKKECSESSSVSNSEEGKKSLRKKVPSESCSISNSEEGKKSLKKKVDSVSCSVSNSEEEKKCLKTKVPLEKSGKYQLQSGPFPCSVCGKVYITKKGIRTHMFIHGDDSEWPYHCSHCARGFVQEGYFKIHEGRCTESAGNVIKCEVCSATFRSDKTYKNHKKGHAEKFSCDICGEKFVTRGGQIRHKRVCSEEALTDRILRYKNRMKKIYSCSMCHRTFALKTAYLVHIESHEGKAPFKCKTCEQKFLSKTNLLRHKCKFLSDP